MATAPPVPISLRIAVVGDVHYDWDPVKDHLALNLLKADLVLFTGNFGEENVELVKSISKLDLPKCVILGNHDCWWSAGQCKSQMMCGGDSCQGSENITAQLRALGPQHVGYGRLDFPNYQISVIGSRPFSSGGSKFNPVDLLAHRYGVRNMRQSELRITEFALGAPVEHSLIFLAHNGPSGLRFNDSGEGWVKEMGNQGDQGDPDLARAIKTVQTTGRQKTPLVVFGHMHRKYGTRRARTTVIDGTVYLYGARVRRCRKMMGIRPIQLATEPQQNAPAAVALYDSEPDDYALGAAALLYQVTDRQFTVVDFQKGELKSIAEVWVRDGDPFRIVGEAQIYTSS